MSALPRWLMVLAVIWLPALMAEPFLAVETGFQCGQCHENPTGGGMRTAFGSTFGQTSLPTRVATVVLPGAVNDQLAIGVDVRAAARQRDIDDQEALLNLGTDRITLYLSARLADSVQLYVDQQLAPGGTLNREAWAKLDFGAIYLKAGRIFLPYGLRLEDDSANIRLITNINFNTPDTGIEFGHVGQHWNAQLSITNGTGGGFEVDTGKMVTARVERVEPGWRLGVSASSNDADASDRRMLGAFAGLRTGPVAWLVEIDRVEDVTAGAPTVGQNLALLEANWKLRQGHYLRAAAEVRTSGDSAPAHLADSRRYSVEYDWFPMPFTQLRLGLRDNDSDNPAPVFNQQEAFVQLHLFF
jgi:hypothetical protein